MTKHGMENTPTWASWRAMVHRCRRKKDKDFYRYGAIGITVCDWLAESPLNLVELIGFRPKGHTIDRVDNNSSYSCGRCNQCKNKDQKNNVRWATPKEQQRNRSITIFSEIDGKKISLAEIAEKYGIGYSTILNRFNMGKTGSELACNPRRARSGHVGIEYLPKTGKWRARISTKHIGNYETLKLAINARNNAHEHL